MQIARQGAYKVAVAWAYVNTDGECEQIEWGEPFDDPSVTKLYLHPADLPALPEGWVEEAAMSIAHMVDEWTQRGWNNEGRAQFARLVARRLRRFVARRAAL